MSIRFEHVTDEHKMFLLENAPIELHNEMKKIDDDPLEYHLEDSVSSSIECFAAMHEDVCIGITGVTTENMTGDRAYPWFMNTIYAQKHPRSLLRGTLNCLDRWSLTWPMLYTLVDNEYKQANRWMKWAGFHIAYEGSRFNHYYLERETWERELLLPAVSSGVYKS